MIVPTDVEREIVEIVEQLEKGNVALTEYSDKLVKVGIAYDLAYAKAMVRADGRSESQRKAQALLIVEELFREKQTLEGQVRLVKEVQHTLRAQLLGVQSIGANVRSSMWQGQGSGGNPSARRPGDG